MLLDPLKVLSPIQKDLDFCVTSESKFIQCWGVHGFQASLRNNEHFLTSGGSKNCWLLRSDFLVMMPTPESPQTLKHSNMWGLVQR